jgi:glucokinase
MSKSFYLGVDMGGTHIKIAIVNEKCLILEEAVINTDIEEQPVNIIKNILSETTKFKNYSKIKSIGVGVAGDIDYEKGFLRFSPNLPKWKKIPLKNMFEKLFHKKTFIDNDANTAGLGAFHLDSKGRAKSLICVTLGTGVGGGIALNGKIYRGVSGTAGEIGHITIDPNGTKCNCGNYGCIETFVGAKHFSRFASEYIKKHKSVLISKFVKENNSQMTPHILFNAAQLGDKTARDIWKITGEKIGIFISILINFANPDMIVFCGGISKASKYFLEYAEEEAGKRAFKSAIAKCQIKISQHENKLGVVGAAMLFL